MKLDLLGYLLPLAVFALPLAFAHDHADERQPLNVKQLECEKLLTNSELLIHVQYADAKASRDDVKAFCRS